MLSVDLTALVVFFLVWILVIVLSKIFFNPLRKAMDQRESGLRLINARCSQAIEEARDAAQKIEDGLKEARMRSDAVRKEHESEALKNKQELLAELQEEHRKRVERAKSDLSRQVETLKKELEAKASAMAEAIKERLLH